MRSGGIHRPLCVAKIVILLCCLKVLTIDCNAFLFQSSLLRASCHELCSRQHPLILINSSGVKYGRFKVKLNSKEDNEQSDWSSENDPSVDWNENDNSSSFEQQQAKQRDNQAVSTVSTRQLMSMMGTSPRRIFLSISSAATIALAGNLFGCTSALLSIVPEELVEQSKLDLYFPRGNFKRFQGSEYGYTFQYPKEWVADTALELAKAQSRVRKLDYSMEPRKSNPVENSAAGASTTVPRNILPDAAFGPPGRLNSKGVSEQGDTNVSVIATPVRKGFTLESTLGDPKNAAETLLKVSLAPEGSGRVATLMNAYSVDGGSGQLSQGSIYRFEYIVDRERGVRLRAISVIAERNRDTLITFTVVAPASNWENVAENTKLQGVASSFKLLKDKI